MANSGYISANLTSKQLHFIRLLNEHEIDIFNSHQIEELLHVKFDNLNEILENLVDKKMLVRIEKGKFCKPSLSDESVIGCFIIPDGAVAYWSALNKHGLTEQFPNNIYIQTTKNKLDKNIFGTNYKFIRIQGRKQTGVEAQGTGNHKYRITNVDKTIIDCFDLPEHSGGYAELIRAFYNAKITSERMIEYCIAIDNIAATKRMGFLAKILEKKNMKTFVTFAMKKVNAKYNLFDPAGAEKGEFVNDWRLRLNISRNDILEICNR